MQKIYAYLVPFFLLGSVATSFMPSAHAQTATPTPTPDTSAAQQALQAQIADLENKIADTQGQEKTLSSQISVFNNQITLTEYKIEQTKEQILSVEQDIDTTQKKITSLDGSLQGLMKVFVSRVIATYQSGTTEPIQVLLTSNNVDNFVVRSNYLKLVQAHDKQLILDTYQAKNDYSNQKDILETKKQKILALQSQLQDYTTQLDSQKKQKQVLLSETQGSEARYQSLLSQAKAQLAGFSSFTDSQGGASLLSGQTYCNDWGCYYNQRDSQWGGVALNHTQYTIASDGCLMTSVAMIYTHYGHRDVTPLSINSNPDNFASYYPAYLKYSVSANGVSSSRVGAVIDSVLQSGNPVIVGIRYGNGGTHFVVLKGGSGGNYMMYDPYTPNGHDIAFSSKYSLGSIFEVDKVVM